jgi:hypothetical protein
MVQTPDDVGDESLDANHQLGERSLSALESFQGEFPFAGENGALD